MNAPRWSKAELSKGTGTRADKATARRLIIHADDAGLSSEIDEGIIRALRARAVSSASVIASGPTFESFALFARCHPQFDVGVHLAVTNYGRESRARLRSVADPRLIPDLVDSEGFFRMSWAMTPPPALQVELELHAQVSRAAAHGIRVSHLDSHQFALVRNGASIFDAFIRVGRMWGLPILVGRNWEARWPWLGGVDFVVSEVLWAGGAVPLEQLESHYDGLLERLPPGLSQLIVHPAVNDQATGNVDIAPWGSVWRARDLSYLMNPAFGANLSSRGIEIVDWRDTVALPVHSVRAQS